MNPIVKTIDSLASEVGRLRRRVDPGSTLVHLADRLADHIERLDSMTQPCAAQLYGDFFGECGDHDVALAEALAVTDARARHLRALLGTGGKDELSDMLAAATPKRAHSRIAVAA